MLTAAGGGTGHVTGTYHLNILGLDGQAGPGNPSGYAQTSRSVIQDAVHGIATYLPLVSVSSDRIYYLDGDSTVRYVGADGQGVAATVPGSQTAHAAFAVSPDNKRIAVSVLDYAKSPVSMRLYVEDLGTGANHVEIFSSSNVYEWPVGWHAGHLVTAVGSAYMNSEAPNPYEAVGGYHVVDPTNGNRLAVMGSTACAVTGPLTAGGTACVDSSGLHSVDWTGGMVLFGGNGINAGALSPDGGSIAACCAMTNQSVYMVRRDGTTKPLQVIGPFEAWVDATHLLSGSSISGPFTMTELTTGAVTPWTGSGSFFEGSYPADLG